MLTPKEVEEQRFPLVQFRKGYEINSVDAFLDTLTADYSALYEENATLKAKMKVLVQYIGDQASHIRELELAAEPADAAEEETEFAPPVLTILPAPEAEEEEAAAEETEEVPEVETAAAEVEEEPAGV